MLDKVLRERTVHNVLFYIIAVFFVFFLSWAYVAEIDQVVRAEAVVEPVGKVQQVQSRYPGSVEKLDVEVGDIIEKGRVLIALDTQEAQSTFDMAKNKITAVLGPTNTGKTFLAIETMLSFDSGMIGFPLRLLAREVYDKIIKKINPTNLIATGLNPSIGDIVKICSG